MPSFRTGVVERVLSSTDAVQRLEVRIGDAVRTAVLYPRYAAPAQPGDRVAVNTTAVDLGLGTGGEDFVVFNLAHATHDAPSGGHIMKLRYTPAQSDVLAVEAPESPHHDAMASATTLGGIPVVAASLHSQLLPVVVAMRGARPGVRIAYVMTDGGALEAALSHVLCRLRELGWISSVVTTGQAMGGDLEAVNVFSGLLAARAVVGADVVVCGMGPGVVGTSTAFGTTAVEVGVTINATAALGGSPVVAVRMSSGDPRERHRGLSHHVRVALERVALTAADLPVPPGQAGLLEGLGGGHRVVEVDVAGVLDALRRAEAEGLRSSHMGRGLDADPLFFEAAAAAGIHAATLIA